jgi:hypothetical protein
MDFGPFLHLIERPQQADAANTERQNIQEKQHTPSKWQQIFEQKL